MIVTREYPKELCMDGDPARGVMVVQNKDQEATFRAQGYRQKYFAYPRSLYLEGDREKEERVVANEKEEEEARALGFLRLGEAAEVKVKRGRK